MKHPTLKGKAIVLTLFLGHTIIFSIVKVIQKYSHI